MLEKMKFSKSYLKSLFRKYYSYQKYKDREINNAVILVNEFLRRIYGESNFELIPYLYN